MAIGLCKKAEQSLLDQLRHMGYGPGVMGS